MADKLNRDPAHCEGRRRRDAPFYSLASHTLWHLREKTSAVLEWALGKLQFLLQHKPPPPWDMTDAILLGSPKEGRRESPAVYLSWCSQCSHTQAE